MTREKLDWEHDRFAASRAAARHPVLVSFLSGAIVGLSPANCGVPVLVRVSIGGGAMLLQLLIWMPSGPGGRWARRLPPPNTGDGRYVEGIAGWPGTESWNDGGGTLPTSEYGDKPAEAPSGRGPLTQSDKRLITTIGVLAILGVLQILTGLTIAALIAFVGAVVLLVIFVVSRGKQINR